MTTNNLVRPVSRLEQIKPAFFTIYLLECIHNQKRYVGVTGRTMAKLSAARKRYLAEHGPQKFTDESKAKMSAVRRGKKLGPRKKKGDQ